MAWHRFVGVYPIWQVTVHAVTRAGHNLSTKPPPPPSYMWLPSFCFCFFLFVILCLSPNLEIWFSLVFHSVPWRAEYLDGLLMLVLRSENSGSESSVSLRLGVVNCHVSVLLLYSGIFNKFALLFFASQNCLLLSYCFIYLIYSYILWEGIRREKFLTSCLDGNSEF